MADGSYSKAKTRIQSFAVARCGTEMRDPHLAKHRDDPGAAKS
jgi:hypothetical protein